MYPQTCAVSFRQRYVQIVSMVIICPHFGASRMAGVSRVGAAARLLGLTAFVRNQVRHLAEIGIMSLRRTCTTAKVLIRWNRRGVDGAAWYGSIGVWWLR